jgi:hypothetical protein
MINVKNEFVIQIFDIQNSTEYNEETQNPKANKIKELRIQDKIADDFKNLYINGVNSNYFDFKKAAISPNFSLINNGMVLVL